MFEKEKTFFLPFNQGSNGAGNVGGAGNPINENGYFYNEDLAEIGHNSFSLIKDYNKTCNYICKYITKDCVKNSHNQIFMRSND